MASYFAFDHVGWAAGAGLVTNKTTIEKCQKVSTWSWLLGSCSTILIELTEVMGADMRRKEGETDGEWAERRHKLDQSMLRLLHAVIQAGLAVGLLQLRPWSNRKTAAFGVAASALNCFMLLPPRPAAPKAKGA